MNLKRIFALALAVLMLGTVLAACGDDKKPAGTTASTDAHPSPNADYKVSLVNAIGKPYTSGIIVKFMRGGEQIAMVKADEQGVATKNLERGDYTLEIMSTDGVEYVFDATQAALTAEKTEAELCLSLPLSGESIKLFQNNEQDENSGLTAYYVNAGCTQVNLEPGKRNYFVFVPQEAGEYHISTVGQVEGFGYYGSPFFMADIPLAAVEDNGFTVNLYSDMISHGTGTDVMILGIDAGSATQCVLSVDRVGAPQWTPEQEPYVVYATTAKLAPYTLPAGKSTVDFDLTAATDNYKLVLGEDGFYHLNDANGPLVLVKLGVDNKYMACYQTVLTKTGVRAYFYDENGKFLRREKYDDCLREYFEVMDAKAGVYPLTEDLRYIIQTHGAYNKWWDLESERSIFRDTDGNPISDINADIAWLFMCCYISQ